MGRLPTTTRFIIPHFDNPFSCYYHPNNSLTNGGCIRQKVTLPNVAEHFPSRALSIYNVVWTSMKRPYAVYTTSHERRCNFMTALKRHMPAGMFLKNPDPNWEVVDLMYLDYKGVQSDKSSHSSCATKVVHFSDDAACFGFYNHIWHHLEWFGFCFVRVDFLLRVEIKRLTLQKLRQLSTLDFVYRLIRYFTVCLQDRLNMGIAK